MRGIFWTAMTLTAFAVGMTCACMAQTAANGPAKPDMTARVDPPAKSDAGVATTSASSGTTKPEIQPTVTQEIETLKEPY